MRQIIKYCLPLLLVLLFLESDIASSQDNKLDTRGKNFWITFPPNYHNYRWEFSNPELQNGDSISIYIAAEEPTKGTITYFGESGEQIVHTFDIQDISIIDKFKINHIDRELIGFNHSGRVPQDSDLLKPVKKAFYIESEKDVRVYANNQAVTTTDAMLVYPEKTLSNRYFVMSYYSDNSDNSFSYKTPSQFVVLATQDDTEVTVNASDRVFGTNDREFTVILDAGEVYLVQADSRNNVFSDLTGSEIISDKPIAVFSGHQRAKVKAKARVGTSRDHLLEQMPPLQVWGTEAFLVPYPQFKHDPQIGDNDDIFRILAAYDNTEVYLNGSIIDVLDKGEYYEGILDAPYYAEANKPIMVAQLKKSSTYQSMELQNGDPFLKIIPTAELYLNYYRFINIQAWQVSFLNFYEPVYEEQYVTVISRESNIESLRLDGMDLADNISFESIPGTDYKYSHIRVSDGVHYIEGDEEFGIYVYGIGGANSYGYVGGMSVNPIDHNPPKIQANMNCFKLSGSVTDTAEIDSGIDEVIIDESVTENVNIEIAEYQKYAEVVGYTAELLNPYLDGVFQLKSFDSIGLSDTYTAEIPGFTVALNRQVNKSGTEKVLIEREIPDTLKFCEVFILVNYGKFPQRIDQLNFRNLTISEDNYEISDEFPILLQPGQSRQIEVCFHPEARIISTEMYIENECMTRGLSDILLIFGKDEQKPQIASKDDDPCDGIRTIILTDSLVGNFGFGKVEIIETQNCDIRTVFESQFEIRLEAIVLDQNQDAFYRLKAIDAYGNEEFFEERISALGLR